MFTVRHYAGDVAYESQGFLVKNKDRLNEDTYVCSEFERSMVLNGDAGVDPQIPVDLSQRPVLGGEIHCKSAKGEVRCFLSSFLWSR